MGRRASRIVCPAESTSGSLAGFEGEESAYPPLKAPTGFLTGVAATTSIIRLVDWKVRRAHCVGRVVVVVVVLVRPRDAVERMREAIR